jgi:crotonobetainyl-CoA:carnitine CoA-transferase CaiB-like acyl-CoA transferase
MARPLDGVRVIDLSRVVSGPICCWQLAALGAEVVRVEPPGGDVTWRNPPFVRPDNTIHDGPRGAHDIPLSPLRKGRGKRSIELDLSQADGRRLMDQLITVSDVLVENFKPGVLERFGLTWPEVHERNPRLVMCSISGYGPTGPYRDRPAMDVVIQAVSGLMAKTGQPDGPPTKTGATVGDLVPSIFAALGVVAALRQRDHTNEGQHVDVAMLDSLLALLWDEPIDHYADSGIPVRFGNGDPRGAPFGTYRTTDGWIAISASADNHWAVLGNAIGGPELVARWPNHMDRVRDRHGVDSAVTAFFAQQSTAEAVDLCIRLKLPAGPVNDPGFARTDAHVALRGALVRLQHGEADTPTEYLGAAFPVRLSASDTSTSPAEPLGSSTEAVLGELLKLTPVELARLRAVGAFGPPRA